MVRVLYIFCFLFLSHALEAQTKLFENNRWFGPVVIPQNPEIDEYYAAQTLIEWGERVTGVRPELVEENNLTLNPNRGIFIGRTALAKAANVSAPEIGGDIATRVIHQDAVFLIGNRPYATRIAAGRFCEQVLGVTFAFPGERGADWESKKEIPSPSFDLFQPDFKWRRVTGIASDEGREWAYNLGCGKTPEFSHALYAAFNKKIWDEDPTLFADLGKGREKPTGNEFAPNPNLAHPKATAVGAQFVQEWFKNNPRAFSAPMGVNDCMLFDQSVSSEGWFRDRPVRTDYVMGYLNRVAELVWQPKPKGEDENQTLGTLAYLQTQRAPTISLNPAIFPWVCADRIGYANAEFAKMDEENLSAWVKSGVRYVGAYDYWYGAGFACPRIHFTAQADSIRAAHRAGVVGWYAEVGGLWAFDAPKVWLGAKLLEQPHADSDALLDQWFEAAYGVAAVPMRNAYRTIEGAWQRDAQQGGKNQWIRHFLDEESTLVLDDSEIKAISFCLKTAEDALKEITSSKRESNRQWRLAQFHDAWNLVFRFRETVLARRSEPANPADALEAFKHLNECERRYQAYEDDYNFKWGRSGAPIKWSKIVNTDPRYQWGKLIAQDPTLSQALKEISAQDQYGLSGVYALWREYEATATMLHRPATAEDFLKEWAVSLGGRRTAQRGREGLLQIDEETGTLTHREKVQSKSLVKFSVGLKPSAANVRIGMQFNANGKTVSRMIQCDARAGTLILPVPEGVQEVECKVQFTDKIDLMSVEIQSLALPR